MSGRYLTDMADVLRAAGCNVVEQSGWQSRARSSGGYADGRPWVVMWHHTASNPGTSAANNVNYIISGSPDAPIANLYLHNDGTFYVCAGGATNTNGKGGPTAFSKGTVPLDSMNTYAIGIEAGNSGVGEAWPQVMIDAFFKGSNALATAYGLLPTDICSHAEYAPTRKIDPATAAAVQGPWEPRSINSSGTWNVEDMRAEAQKRAATPIPPKPEPIPPGPPLTGEDMTVLAKPIRVWDSRPGSPQGGNGKHANAETYFVNVAAFAGIPEGARGVLVNITVLDADAKGYLTAFGGGGRPDTSNINYAPGDIFFNVAAVPLDATGFYVYTQSACNVLVDLQAWST